MNLWTSVVELKVGTLIGDFAAVVAGEQIPRKVMVLLGPESYISKGIPLYTNARRMAPGADGGQWW